MIAAERAEAVAMAMLPHRHLYPAMGLVYVLAPYHGAWPGPTVAQLAGECRVTDRTVRRWIRRLEGAGVLVVDRPPGGPGTYWLVTP